MSVEEKIQEWKNRGVKTIFSSKTWEQWEEEAGRQKKTEYSGDFAITEKKAWTLYGKESLKDYTENGQGPRDNWDLFQEDWKRSRKTRGGLHSSLSLLHPYQSALAGELQRVQRIWRFDIWKLGSLLEIRVLISNVETFSGGLCDPFTFSFH